MKTHLAITLVVLAASMSSPVSAGLSLDHVVGEGSTPNNLAVDTDIGFYLRLTNNNDSAVVGLNHGFQVWSPDGASWRPITLDTMDIGWSSRFDFGMGTFANSVTGWGADTVGFYAVAMYGEGFPLGYSQVVLSIGTEVYLGDEGLTLCLDSAFIPPTVTWYWAWSGGGVIPSWDGPHCWEIEQIPNAPPFFTNNPVSLFFDHCNLATYDFDATDPEGSPLWFTLISGMGAVEGPTGVWQYMPMPEDVMEIHTLGIEVCDTLGACDTSWTEVIFTNEPPVFVEGCDAELYGYQGQVVFHDVEAEDADACDALTFSIQEVQPYPLGVFTIDGAGDFEFNSDPTDEGTFTFTVHVEDGLDFTACQFTITIVAAGDIPGVSFGQTDFYFDSLTLLNSDWGAMEVDIEQLVSYYGFNDGYLNVYTDQGWVVDNIWLDTADGFGSILTYFQLLSAPGEDVSALTAHIEYTSEPVDSFTDGPRSSFAVIPDEVAISDGEDTLETSGFVGTPPEPIFTVDSAGTPSKKNDVKRPNVPNVQAAKSQCVPAAIANSLQWLENRYKIKVPHDHKPGLKGDNSLVGQLDKYMKRWVGGTKPSRRKGKGVNRSRMINGKFEYMKKNGLSRKIVCKHQGTKTGGLPDQAKYTRHGVSSTNESVNGYVTWEWIKQQIDNGEDVELSYWRYSGTKRKGGHCVMVVGWKKVRGRKYIYVAHDKKQTYRDRKDKKGCKVERIRIKGKDPLRYKTNSRRIVFAFSESADNDMDGVPDSLDNAPTYYNPNQEDTNDDGVGDVAQSPYLDSVAVSDYVVSGSGGEAETEMYAWVNPEVADHKDIWFVGHAHNPHPTDSARIVIAFAYRDEFGATQFTDYNDTTELPADTIFEIFGGTTLDACSDSIGVRFKAIDGQLTIDSGQVFAICYGDFACCVGTRGNIDYDTGDVTDISDLVYIIDYMFNAGPAPPCLEEADIDGSGEINIGDLVYLVDYMFNDGPAPQACP
ncbi:MAG: VCBS domain-containing protein [candidate division Zixibacteria bacterium]|nr:VCBS domain-containing protein [candidate division Zixibacteria bacterium]MDH3937324.1 VCBS domain-containing protein [candidate division Zixibacteria bacterium]MDH4033658.1 VCBS domain-containing protein [candidate division Zixibacteria bacterium]